MRRFAKTIVVLVAVAALGCNKGPSGNGGGGEEKVLNLYTWSEYFPQGVLDEFTKRTGIKVNQTNFSTNEELISKLASGVVDYDVVVPSDYAVRILILDKRLAPLDGSKLGNFKNLDPRLLGQAYDRENQYSLPLYWGTTGIGVNREQITEPVDSWAVLFDAKNNQKISMLADARENFAVALKLMGKSVNETDPAVLEEAARRLRQQTKLVKSYDNDSFDDKLRTGEAALVQGFNGQLAKVVAENPRKFYYVVPREGATHWIDNIAIRAGSKHAGNAHRFIDYVLDARVAGEMVNQVRYASANAAAKQFVNSEILSDANVYAPDEVLKRCEVMDDVGKAAPLIDKLWTQIKAGARQ